MARSKPPAKARPKPRAKARPKPRAKARPKPPAKARPKRAARTTELAPQRPAPSQIAPPAGVTLTLRSLPIQQLVTQLLEVERRVGLMDSDARVQMGGLLRQMHEQLDPGDWLDWLASDVPFTARSAQMYIRLHNWSRMHRGAYRMVAPIGPSKLYLLTALDGPTLRTLVRRKIHIIPDTGDKRTLAGMTVRELAQIVAALVTNPDDEAPADRALQIYRRRVQALLEATDALAAYPELPHGELQELHATLVGAAEQLAAVFALDG